jgi:hypothetical protein
MTNFRFPERMGAFSLWIAPEIYPLVEAAKKAGEQHRALLRERVLMSLPGERPDLSGDEEFLQSATGLFRRFEELWTGLERAQSLHSVGDAPNVRRVFLASAVEWAMDLHYEVREVSRVKEGDRVRWRVTGRAWDGERPFDDQQLSEAYVLGDRRTGELALLETLSRAFCGAIGGLIGWSALVPEAREPRATV